MKGLLLAACLALLSNGVHANENCHDTPLKFCSKTFQAYMKCNDADGLAQIHGNHCPAGQTCSYCPTGRNCPLIQPWEKVPIKIVGVEMIVTAGNITWAFAGKASVPDVMAKISEREGRVQHTRLIDVELHAAAVAGLDAGQGARVGLEPVDQPGAEHQQHDDQRRGPPNSAACAGGPRSRRRARSARRGGVAGQRRRRLDRPGERAPGRRTSEWDDGHADRPKGALRRRDLARRPFRAQAAGHGIFGHCGRHGRARSAGSIGAPRWRSACSPHAPGSLL